MIKKIFLLLEDFLWNIRCKYNFWVHGPYGVANCVKKMPFAFLIKYLRKYGATIGEDCIIDSGIVIHRPGRHIPFKNLKIGNNVYIGHNLIVDLTDEVSFFDNSACGANCQLWTHVGDYTKNLRDNSDYHETIGPIKIKEGVICYSGTIINPGITIDEYSRVLAGSVVTKNVVKKEIWGGTPAKFIKRRD